MLNPPSSDTVQFKALFSSLALLVDQIFIRCESLLFARVFCNG